MTEKSRYMYITEPNASVIDHRPISSYKLYDRSKIRNSNFCIRIRVSSFNENQLEKQDNYYTINDGTKMIRLYDADIACVLVRMKNNGKWRIRIDDVFSKSIKQLIQEDIDWILKFKESRFRK